jgi:hypothetical protein
MVQVTRLSAMGPYVSGVEALGPQVGEHAALVIALTVMSKLWRLRNALPELCSAARMALVWSSK